MGDAISQRPSGRDIWLALAECAIVAALFVADAYHHIFFSKTPYLFLLGWASLRWRGMRWKDVGFAWPKNWKAALLVGVLCGLFIEAFELFISQPLLARWMGKMPDLSNFAAVHGNLKVTLIYMLLIWMLAAFGEELVYRGYLMNRLAGLFRGTRAAWLLLFCLMIRRTGSLWFAVGFHAAWDWAETFFYGTPDSGLLGVGRFLNTSVQGPNWLTGGSAGPEGSIFAIFILLLCAALIHLRFPKAIYLDRPV